MTDFGIRLKEAMQEKGITASELSRQSGVGKNMISYYLAGKCLAKQDKVYLLAKTLGVDPGWLMTGVEPEKTERTMPIVIPDTEMFMKITNYMSREEYDTVMEIFNRTIERMKEKGLIDL